MKDLISIADLSSKDIQGLIDSAIELKRKRIGKQLAGKTLALIFEKPSLRTRVSFDVGMYELGGHSIYLSPAEIGLGKREPVEDVAAVLSRYVHGIMARTFSHDTVVQLAKYATVPVINGLSDEEHPCQILADLQTIYEKKGALKGLSVAYIGDANNCANSLLLACAITGMEFRIACPAGYAPSKAMLLKAKGKKGRVVITDDPKKAVSGADVIYTDVWTSMGQEEESAKRRKDFSGYQVNGKLIAVAKKDVILMHPLPAHYGEEVAAGMLRNPHSVVFDQAENRLHMQKAILVKLMK
ncbi:MAG: ornithine carbamoyltransferase [Dehalococcoidia bacterium]